MTIDLSLYIPMDERNEGPRYIRHYDHYSKNLTAVLRIVSCFTMHNTIALPSST